ncbi:DNA polymerase III, subunit gamma and tau [Candidatus Saccharibacteria bacterium RAAC3_TM7_1]|nr:DNA polymerase III, subunit gamma and tau [Candidatus Saccharibacteria bacterium RAAC3_TM7_1]HCZ28570.1 DNA polymerase III subunit gamma/tau [Candidatus Saccharibacteria bacterium]
MGVALYRKYRSRSLADIVGQPQVTELLTNAIKQGKIAHAYLFTGPKGTGKTSIARILAHEINNLPYKDDTSHLDIIEIDAASNNGVEDIRDLRDRVQIAPVSAKKKVYIIDEVHMLSKPAFNALLKTLEEPPEHVVFILATTDLDKVPATILSRTQRHTFRRASIADLVKNLRSIAKKEKINIDDAALELIAHHSDGSFRDSVSLFDQLAASITSGESLSKTAVLHSLGLADDEKIDQLLRATLAGDIQTVTDLMDEISSRGTSARTIVQQLHARIRSELPAQPGLAILLDRLLDVSRSGYPELKLLTTLSLFSVPQTVDVPIADTPISVPKPVTTVSKVKPTASADKSKDDKASDSVAATPPKKKSPKNAQPFEWQKLLEYVRSRHVALHSVLTKCEAVLDGETLLLYTKSPFYKKKLDDSRYRVLLNDSIDAVGFSPLEIVTKGTAAPLKDSQAAKVAAIMGGGEDVSVE